MNTIEQAQEVANNNREFTQEIGYMPGNGPEARLHLCLMADTIDALIAELALITSTLESRDRNNETLAAQNRRLQAELATLKGQEPAKISQAVRDYNEIVDKYNALLAAGAQERKPLDQDWIEERAHRRCRRYIMIDTEAPYQFNAHTLMDLVRDIEAKIKEQP